MIIIILPSEWSERWLDLPRQRIRIERTTKSFRHCSQESICSTPIAWTIVSMFLLEFHLVWGFYIQHQQPRPLCELAGKWGMFSNNIKWIDQWTDQCSAMDEFVLRKQRRSGHYTPTVTVLDDRYKIWFSLFHSFKLIWVENQTINTKDLLFKAYHWIVHGKLHQL